MGQGPRQTVPISRSINCKGADLFFHQPVEKVASSQPVDPYERSSVYRMALLE